MGRTTQLTRVREHRHAQGSIGRLVDQVQTPTRQDGRLDQTRPIEVTCVRRVRVIEYRMYIIVSSSVHYHLWSRFPLRPAAPWELLGSPRPLRMTNLPVNGLCLASRDLCLYVAHVHDKMLKHLATKCIVVASGQQWTELLPQKPPSSAGVNCLAMLLRNMATKSPRIDEIVLPSTLCTDASDGPSP